MLSTIPLYTTYGYIFNVWLPVLLGINIVFVEDSSTSNLARRIIDEHVNVLLANSTIVEDLFASQDDNVWRHLQYVLTGIDRVSADVKDQLVNNHGLHVSESLSFTELGTLISVNTPHYNLVDISGKEITQPGSNGFSYGRCVPGLAVKTVNPQNFDDTRDEGEEGVLLVKGAAISRFDGQSDEIFHKGWYVTKRICSINSHGFIELVDDEIQQIESLAG
jgi:acyl-CoA synthetase (AMP-forming)/AMP-acid ligase II